MYKPLLLYIFLLINSFAIAQTDSLKDQRRKINMVYTSLYKENSELSYTVPMGEIGAPSRYIINGKLTTTYLILASGNSPIAFAVHPDFTVRVRNDRSAAVRTPSFKLGGTLYLRLAKDVNNYKYAEMEFTHHSNGQDGKSSMEDGSVNTKNGNFNTNYLLASYSFGKSTDPFKNKYMAYHHKVGMEVHKLFNYDPILEGDYGFTRLNYDISFRIYQFFDQSGKPKTSKNSSQSDHFIEKETWRFNGRCSYAINKYDNYQFLSARRRLNIEISSNYSLPFMQNVFLMASFGYYGEDPYNIYFKDKYAYLRFGLSTTFLRYKVR